MTTGELAAIRELLTSRPKPENPTPAELRGRLEKLADYLPAPDDIVEEKADAGGVPAAFVSAPGADPGRHVLYLHGGGYVIGSVATHRTLTHGLSKASGARVLSLDYRLAPEHPFPAAVEDAVAGYRWLLDRGADPGRIAIAGDSAGGGLTVAAMLAARARGLPLPAAAVCFSPWVDMEGLGESMETRAAVDPMVQKEGLLWYAGLYLGGADARDPLAAPLYADLAGLPPVLVQVGDAETLLDDATRLAARLRAAGTEVELDVWPDMIHVWQLFAPILSEGREAVAKAGRFVARHIGQGA